MSGVISMITKRTTTMIQDQSKLQETIQDFQEQIKAKDAWIKELLALIDEKNQTIDDWYKKSLRDVNER